MFPQGERERISLLREHCVHEPGGYCATGSHCAPWWKGSGRGGWIEGEVYSVAWKQKTGRFWRALGAANMAGSSASEVIFISVNHNITLMGKVWLIVMIFLRLLILLLAGYPLYQDEQERFVCNTIQPGCANVCYDLFSPISLFRFWLVQLVTMCLPSIIFIIYVVHKVSNGLSVDLNSSGHTKALPLFKIHQEPFSKTSVNKMPLVAERGWARFFTGAYILHLMFRTLLEAGFGAAHYYLFGFYIPRRFLCQHPPCTTQVDCYISRPTEKTVMLNFMLGVAALSLFLNVLDFICAIKRSVQHKSKRKMMVEKVYEEEQCFLSARGASTGIDPNASLARQDLEAEAGHKGSFRKRQGSKGSCGGGVLALGQEPPCLERSSLPRSPGPSGCNTNGNNGYSFSQEEAPERNGSEVALCPPEPMGTPRSIRVSKRSRLKPPPPPRRDLGSSPSEPAVPFGSVSTATAICSRKVGVRRLSQEIITVAPAAL
ncbi:gap junction delta-4 protein-like isoform X2 [Epinephelus moara]|uniref:gap junction delta-4 protein-like isoform X2 n=1 Tax=Epinephelus moara TaxID=300413 RepID=UPI00214ED6BF|nr:gap junction delta-4 protein-like isoform X2 [Epinephelus moara]